MQPFRAKATISAILLSGAVALADPAAAAEKIVFLTSWYAQAEHGGFYQAKATGLYEKAGLDVEIRMGGPQVNGMQLLLAGEADAIMGYDIQVLQAVEKGLPAVTVAASFQSDLQGMMTHEDVKSLAGVKDRTILVSSAGMTAWWPWLKKKYGLSNDQAKAYTFNLQPFFADRAVAQQAYPSSEPFQAQEKGMPVNFYLFAKDGYPPYGTTIVTTRRMIEAKPEAMRKFVAASMEGWKSYVGNPGPANALIKAANPKMSDAQIAFGVAKLKELRVLGGEENVPIGTMTEVRWKASYDYLVEAGLLSPRADWRRAFSLDFMPVLTAKAE